MKKLTLLLLAIALVIPTIEAKPKSENTKKDDTILVGTYNVWTKAARASQIRRGNALQHRSWDISKEAVAQIIVDTGFDIFGIQEADAAVQEELPALVKKAGGKYDFWFCQAYPPESGRNACGGIVYRKDRFKLSDKHIFWLSPTPDVPSKGWDEKKYYRIAASAIVTDKWTGKRFHFIYTHGPLGKEANAHSAEIIVEREKMYNKEGLVSILVGDMNARPSSQFYETVTAHYEDTYKVAKGRTTVDGTFLGAGEVVEDLRNTERRIDHIYIRSDKQDAYEVLYYDVNTNKYNVGNAVTFPSDHLPVTAKIRIK